jgi:hypothetical protein
MILYCSQIQYSHMVAQKQARDLWGLGLRKKTKDLSALSASHIEERGHGEGVGVHVTLLQSDTVQSYGRAMETLGLWGLGFAKNQRT